MNKTRPFVRLQNKPNSNPIFLGPGYNLPMQNWTIQKLLTFIGHSDFQRSESDKYLSVATGKIFRQRGSSVPSNRSRQ
jgi:hypothetical protein